jgi:hypothetical protein
MKKRRFNDEVPLKCSETNSGARNKGSKSCFEEFVEAPQDNLSRGSQRHLRYNPETKKCSEQPFPLCINKEEPCEAQQEDVYLDEGIFSKDYFEIKAGDCKEATPVDFKKKSPKNQLSLSFRDSASLNEYELEDFAEL